MVLAVFKIRCFDVDLDNLLTLVLVFTAGSSLTLGVFSTSVGLIDLEGKAATPQVSRYPSTHSEIMDMPAYPADTTPKSIEPNSTISIEWLPWIGGICYDDQGNLILFFFSMRQNFGQGRILIGGEQIDVIPDYTSHSYENGVLTLGTMPRIVIDYKIPHKFTIYANPSTTINMTLEYRGPPLWYSKSVNLSDMIPLTDTSWIGGYDGPVKIAGIISSTEGTTNFSGYGIWEHIWLMGSWDSSKSPRLWFFFNDDSYYGVLLIAWDYYTGATLAYTGRIGIAGGEAFRWDQVQWYDDGLSAPDYINVKGLYKDINGVNRGLADLRTDPSKAIHFGGSVWIQYPTVTGVVDSASFNGMGWGEAAKHGTIPRDGTPPTTFDNYDGSWHNTDFTITLNATDNWSGINETYYRVNDNPIQNLSMNGQPIITRESANNTLEYWSVDIAGNEETHHVLTGIKLDKTDPIGSIKINNDDTYTTSASVALTLTAFDATSGVDKVRYSNDGVWDAEPWETPSTIKAWNLIMGDGTRTVYYQIKDHAGLLSPTYSDTIILDTSALTGSIVINSNDTYSKSRDVTLTLTYYSGGSGVDKVRYSNDGVWDTEIWQTPELTRAWVLTAGDGSKTVYYQIVNKAGLVSITYSDTIILDTIGPTGAIIMDGGATYTNSTSITLMLLAEDSTSGVAQMRFSNDNVTWTAWETYSTSRAWALIVGDGTKTVYVQFMDNAGLTSLTYQDSITLDTIKPIVDAGQHQTIIVGETVKFDANNSTDNLDAVSYEWNFGDGTTGTGKTTTHIYAKAGTYTVTLTIKDAAGNMAIDSTVITVLPSETFPLWTAGAAILAIGAIVTVTIFLKRRKHI